MDKALNKTLITLLCAVIIVIFIYGYASLKSNPASNSDIYRSWIKTEASVIGSEIVMNQKWLTIEYTDNDITYKTKIELSTDEDFKEKTIDIFYNPDNPKEVIRETEDMQ